MGAKEGDKTVGEKGGREGIFIQLHAIRDPRIPVNITQGSNLVRPRCPTYKSTFVLYVRVLY